MPIITWDQFDEIVKLKGEIPMVKYKLSSCVLVEDIDDIHLIYIDNKEVGNISFNYKKDGILTIHLLEIHSEYRRKGIAKQIVLDLAKLFKTKSVLCDAVASSLLFWKSIDGDLQVNRYLNEDKDFLVPILLKIK